MADGWAGGEHEGGDDPVPDGGLGSLELVVRGGYLARRGLRDGDRVTVRLANTDAAAPAAGEVALVAGTAHGHVGRLALGVVRYDAAGRLTVWADWDGPPTRLCCCGDARVVGRVDAADAAGWLRRCGPALAVAALLMLADLLLDPQTSTRIALLAQAAV